MLNRLKVQTILETMVDNVYFQPPESVKLKYPCVIYDLNHIRADHADNLVYNIFDDYTITFITRNADDPLLSRIAMIPAIRHDRSYASDGLYHHVFNLSII